MENGEISCTKGTVSVFWLDEVNFNVGRKSACFALDFKSDLFIFGQNNKNFEKFSLDVFDCWSFKELVQSRDAVLEGKLDFFFVFSWSDGDYVMLLVDSLGLSETLSGLSH